MKYRYFIAFVTNGLHGNATIDRNCEIQGAECIRGIQATLSEKYDKQEIIIINYILIGMLRS